MLYVDYNSTSPMAREVQDAMAPFLGDEFGNPSSIGYPLGRRARVQIELARAEVAKLVGASPAEVVFTSCGTESCFSGIVGSLLSRPHKNHVLASSVEHLAVLETLEFVRSPLVKGDFTLIPVDSRGALQLNDLSDKVRLSTSLISVMHANNETGVIYPLKEIAEFAKQRGILTHTDAIQVAGKLPLNFRDLGVDLMSISAHKFGGPKGIGALIVREGTAWKAPMKGGGQEGGRRGGTEAVPLIIGMGEAARLSRLRLSAESADSVQRVRDHFEGQIQNTIVGCSVNGAELPRLPNTTSLQIEDVLAQELVRVLGDKEVMCSAASACKAASAEPSHVLRAMGRTTMDCLSTIRISFGPASTIEQANFLVQTLGECVQVLRRDALEVVNARTR